MIAPPPARRGPPLGVQLWAAVACLFLLPPSAARAHDVSDELSVGRLSSSGTSAATGYWSDRARGSAQLDEQLALDLTGSVTHYAASQGVTRGDIFQLALGAGYTPNDHFAFDLSLSLSPTSTNIDRGVQVTQARKGAVRDKTSLFGFDLAAEYDTATGDDTDSVVGLALGATDYSTTQAVRLRKLKSQTMPNSFGAPEAASLLQWHAELSFIETLFQDTDLGITGTYYVYSHDAADSGYYGATVFGRVDLGDGIPAVPLRYSIRPSVTQRIGPFSIRLHGQFSDYIDGEGTSLLGGLKVQCKLGSAIRVWLSANLQHDKVSDGTLSNVWFSVGLRWIFG